MVREAGDIRKVLKKREQRYSYGLTLLRDEMERKGWKPPADEEVGKKVVLRAEDIHLAFGGLKALRGVSIDVREGEILSIIGPNGAGKTCLLNVMSGFYRAQKGEVYFNGRRITKWPAYKIAEAGLCRTFQNLGLYTGLSVIDNVLAGRHPHIRYNSVLSGALYFPWASREEVRQRAIAEDIIDFLEMHAVRDHIVGTLPYGVRKRTELARALALEPRVLALDEPLAGMNLDEKEDIARFVLDIHEFLKIPIIIIEHDMGLVMDISDRVIVLDFGEKIAEGSPREIAQNPRVISAYLGEEGR